MAYMESFTVLTCSWSIHGQMQIGKPRSILSSNPSPHLSCHKYQLLSTVSHSSQGLLPIAFDVLYVAPFDLCHALTFTRTFPTPTSNLLAKVKMQDIIKKPQTFSFNGCTIYHPSLWDEVKISSCW